MFRETVGDLINADYTDQILDELVETDGDSDLSRWLLSAVETYKATCHAAGEQPTEEDAWLILLSALQLEDSK